MNVDSLNYIKHQETHFLVLKELYLTPFDLNNLCICNRKISYGGRQNKCETYFQLRNGFCSFTTCNKEPMQDNLPIHSQVLIYIQYSFRFFAKILSLHILLDNHKLTCAKSVVAWSFIVLYPCKLLLRKIAGIQV